MSMDLDFVFSDPLIGTLELRQNTVRAIGDILPLVIARYGIDRADHEFEAEREPKQISLSRTGPGSEPIFAASL